jgi:hypothetical protein
MIQDEVDICVPKSKIMLTIPDQAADRFTERSFYKENGKLEPKVLIRKYIAATQQRWHVCHVATTFVSIVKNKEYEYKHIYCIKLHCSISFITRAA